MDLTKLTPEHLSKLNRDELSAVRKGLIRHIKACNDLEVVMRDRLIDAEEDRRVEQDLAEMPEARRRAIERAVVGAAS